MGEGGGESKKEGKNEGKATEPAPAPEKKQNPQNQKADAGIVLGLYLHCQGCADKVVKSLKFFDGVEEIVADMKNHRVVVKGSKADPRKVQQRLQKKTQKHVELISPIPPPNDAKEKDLKAKADAAKKELETRPQVVIVVLKVLVHCENCAGDVKRCIKKMDGVMMIEVDPKSKSNFIVKGTFDPIMLVKFIYKHSGRQVEILKQEKVSPVTPAQPQAPANNKKDNIKDVKKSEGSGNANANENINNANTSNSKKGKGSEQGKGGEHGKGGEQGHGKGVEQGKGKGGEQDKGGEQGKGKGGDQDKGGEQGKGKGGGEQGKGKGGDQDKGGEQGKSKGGGEPGKGREQLFFYYPPQVVMEQAYAPQIFSDENVHACLIM